MTSLQPVGRRVGTDPGAVGAFVREALDRGYSAVALAPDAANAFAAEAGAPGFTSILVFSEPFLLPGTAVALPGGFDAVFDPSTIRGFLVLEGE